MRVLAFIIVLWCTNVYADGLQGLNYTVLSAGGATPTRTEAGRTILATGTSPQINYIWSTGPVMGTLSDGVMVHWTGYIQWPGTTGQSVGVMFYNSSDDGFSLAINGSYVINNWREQGLSYYNSSGSTTLTAGQVYSVDIWYYENGGSAGVQLWWNMGNGIVLVPTTVLATTNSYWQPVLCCGGSAAPFSANSTNISKATSFVSRTTNDSQVYIQQIGDANTVTVNQSGTKNNYVYYGGSGFDNNITITQSGNASTTTNYSYTAVSGNANNVHVTQTSTGGGKGAFINVQNNNNSVTLSQTDSGSHYAEVGLSGGNKTVNIQQSGSANQMASVQLSGNPTSLSLQQSGSTQQFYSINFNCATAGGCSPISVKQGN